MGTGFRVAAMNARHDLTSVPSSALALSLAESVLRLRGPDVRTFVEQFLSQAAKSSVVRVTGDGKIFRQGLCFPVSGTAPETDTVMPFPGLPPHLLIELGSGHVIGFRINDATPNRLSPTAFMKSIERYLDLLMKKDSFSWDGIQQMIEGTQRKRIKLFDFVLHDDTTAYWSEYFPQGAVRLTSNVLRGLPFTDPGRKKVIAALFDIHSAHYRHACADFMSRLDKDRIKAICVSGLSPHISKYNSFQNTNANSVYRIQAAEAIPLLGYLLGAENHRAERLRHLVDEGQPLWPALADTLGVAEETVRWLRNKTADEVGEAWLGHIHELLPDLSRLPPEKRPKTRDEWTAYTDFILVLNDRFNFSSATRKEDRWLPDLARLGWINAREKFAAMNASPADLLEVVDFVDSLVSALYHELTPEDQRPHFHRNEDDVYEKLSTTIRQLFYETSVLKQVRASLRWHELQLQPADDDIVEDSPDSRDLSKWPTPLDAPLKLGELHAHFLVTPGQLKDEGLRMQHCVGSYAYQCLFGGSNIVSFRDSRGRSISTAELRLDDRGKKLRMHITQHKARSNATPPATAVAALEQLLEVLNDDGMQPRLQDMREQLVQRQARDKLGKRWEVYAPNAPERLRILKAALKLHIGYERFLEAGKRQSSHESFAHPQNIGSPHKPIFHASDQRKQSGVAAAQSTSRLHVERDSRHGRVGFQPAYPDPS